MGKRRETDSDYRFYIIAGLSIFNFYFYFYNIGSKSLFQSNTPLACCGDE